MKQNKNVSRSSLILIYRRLLAFVIDYCIIIIYATALFGLVYFLIEPSPMGPVRGQIVAFFSLTLPVFLYGVLMESSKWKGTIGKRIMKLEVEGNGSNLTRNILKYLPWEIAHTGVHWAYYFNSIDGEFPIFVWIILILPQLIVLLYAGSLFVSSSRQTIYDRLSGKTVQMYFPTR